MRRALLVLGSSLTVMSGFRFVRYAAKAGKPVLIVNQGETRGDPYAALRVNLPSARLSPISPPASTSRPPELECRWHNGSPLRSPDSGPAKALLPSGSPSAAWNPASMRVWHGLDEVGAGLRPVGRHHRQLRRRAPRSPGGARARPGPRRRAGRPAGRRADLRPAPDGRCCGPGTRRRRISEPAERAELLGDGRRRRGADPAVRPGRGRLVAAGVHRPGPGRHAARQGGRGGRELPLRPQGRRARRHPGRGGCDGRVPGRGPDPGRRRAAVVVDVHPGADRRG